MRLSQVFVFILSLVFCACSEREIKESRTTLKPVEIIKDKSIVLHYTKIPSFSSGSGMAYHNGSFYAVGDDDPYLIQVNPLGEILNKWQAWDASQVENGRIKKKVKPDFESIACIPFEKDTLLLIFGSGSKSPKRDVIISFSTRTEEFKTLEGQKFFQWIRTNANLTEDEINLEGAAFHNQVLYLMNRHNNEMYSLPFDGFRHFITTGDTSQFSVTINQFELPTHQKDTARFSGASILAEQNKLLFTATIELTRDWVDDGDILGSFMGEIDLDNLNNKKLTCYPIYNNDSMRFEGKIEALQGFYSEDGITIQFITDDDNGTTGWGQVEY
ncbi:DUF6929 family protein [Brumimicrobium mesophilum]|uniref:DUF6929 family protein n=1 Tax=Brumimicrobium mesophilum TaxID=392717 RepID=UPI000D144246|nr:hypothetical protein [Brumimicrobium mesophilum]